MELVKKQSNVNDRCGLLLINGESLVPYASKDNTKFVPLCYYEGEIDTLKQKFSAVDGWQLGYLKLCCKEQGIRKELFASESCPVISIDDVKSYFPARTKFEHYWPTHLMDSPLVSSAGASSGSAATAATGQWTRQTVTR